MRRRGTSWSRLTVRDREGWKVHGVIFERMRIERAERAVEEPTDRNLLALALYLRARREHLALFCAGCTGDDYSSSRRVGYAGIFFAMIWVGLGLLIIRNFDSWLDGAIIFSVFGILAFGTWLGFRSRIPIEARRSRDLLVMMTARQCPGCGYYLRKLNEIEPGLTRHVEVGPRYCPECGMMWPLIPPPTHEEVCAGTAK